MTTSDELNDRLAQLRAEWPVGSMVDNVMARIAPPAPPRPRHWRRLFAGLAASGLLAAMLLAWLIIASQPATLLAAVQDGLKRAQSAHLTITSWAPDGGAAYKSEIWYRRDEGLRAEEPDQTIVEDGKFQWSWHPKAGGGEMVVVRQRTPGFFTTQLPALLSFPDIPGDWARMPAPDLDREVNGRRCQGFTLTAPDVNKNLSKGAQPVNQPAIRALVLAEPDGRVHEITVQERRDEKTWLRVRQIRIEYDVPVAAERVVARLPAGARVVDRDEAFDGRYPLERALHRVELGGLILAVHDLQPLKNGEGFYVVSSVRGTPEFLKAYPPRRRPLNPEMVMLDVAFQPMSNMMDQSSDARIVMASAARDGVEFSWWLTVPRKFFRIKDGKRVYLAESDNSARPGEPTKARLPLSATYWDEKHRDPNGVQQGVSTLAEVPLPLDRPPTTLEDVAGRARIDLLQMGAGGNMGLLGIAADSKSTPKNLRPMTHFSPETTSDADFAAAVRRGLEDMRELDEVHDLRPEDMLPPAGNGSGKH